MQVDQCGLVVVVCQGPAGGGLVAVGGAADAALGAQADLVGDAQVRLQVVLGQCQQVAALEHFQVHLDGAQGQALGGATGVIGAGVDHRPGALHFVGGVETVEQHLAQAQFRLGVVVGLGVVIATTGAGGAVVAVATAVGGIEVEAGVEAAFGDFYIFIGRKPAVTAGIQFRVSVQRALDRLGQRHCLGVGAGHGDQNRAAEGGKGAHGYISRCQCYWSVAIYLTNLEGKPSQACNNTAKNICGGT